MLSSVISLPIDFQNEKHVKTISDTMRTDLELGTDCSTNVLSPIYSTSGSTELSKALIHKLTSKYSTCPKYLKDTQTFLKNVASAIEAPTDDTKTAIDDVHKSWTEFKAQRNFLEKYQYVEWQRLQFLNKSPMILQAMTYYNMSSPLLSIILPIIGLLIPFWVMRTTSGISFSLSSYLNILIRQFGSHPLGKALRGMLTGDGEGIIYAVVIACFYGFSLYQNVMSCWRFYKNLSHIHSTILTVKTHLEYTRDVVAQLIDACDGVGSGNTLTTYEKYAAYLSERYDAIENTLTDIGDISPWSLSFGNVMLVGQRLHHFYRLYHSEELEDLMLFSFGVCGYYETLRCCCQRISDGDLAVCEFINEESRVKERERTAVEADNATAVDNSGNSPESTELTAMIYPAYISRPDITPVENSINLSKSFVITGPNASGKTTILKSVILNMLLSQTIGAGCYKSAKIECFDEFHSYINIPDTSGRDSLFQAEARRCKEMIDTIVADPSKRHLCIFDELYSGTNPNEARITARTLLKYLSARKVSFLLTTHFYDLCRDLEASGVPMMCMNSAIVESKREAQHTNYRIEHSYKLIEGISQLQGGITVLEELNYPDEILVEAWKDSLENNHQGRSVITEQTTEQTTELTEPAE